jgi:hypothetical protein
MSQVVLPYAATPNQHQPNPAPSSEPTTHAASGFQIRTVGILGDPQARHIRASTQGLSC